MNEYTHDRHNFIDDESLYFNSAVVTVLLNQLMLYIYLVADTLTYSLIHLLTRSLIH